MDLANAIGNCVILFIKIKVDTHDHPGWSHTSSISWTIFMDPAVWTMNIVINRKIFFVNILDCHLGQSQTSLISWTRCMDQAVWTMNTVINRVIFFVNILNCHLGRSQTSSISRTTSMDPAPAAKKSVSFSTELFRMPDQMPRTYRIIRWSR